VFAHIIYSILSVCFCLLIGKSIEFFLPILPASLYGMAIFTLLLHTRLLNAQRIQPCIEWALTHMALCFIPAGVGIINHFELIKQHGIALVAIIFFTTFLLLTLVGVVYQRQINQHELTTINEPSNDK
jgi:holin-like protein